MKAKKIITSIITTLIIVGALYVGYTTINKSGILNNNEGFKTLQKPTNLSFNEETYTLSWNEVKHADQYIASIDGKQETIETNTFYYISLNEVTEFKVIALDSTGTYLPSQWSDTYTYTLRNDFSYAKVGAYVNKHVSGRELQKIICVYVNKNSLYFSGVFDDNGNDRLYDLKFNYSNDATSIEDAITNEKIKDIDVNDLYKIAEYDSASYLLQSNTYAGEMEQRRLEGYEFSVVSSQAVKSGDNEIFKIYSTYKLTKGQEMKYISNTIECYVPNASSNEKTNFTTKLIDPESRMLREYSYHELKGDEIDFAKIIEELNA
ncbi:MAG: hypothetical protein J1F31_04560 [Erysipelotrichales bacterium]|nr:hypothetical protein [Erysipelotrichales bacterium]